MAYFGELRSRWRLAVAITVGMSSGYMLNNYLASVFAPHLLKEFGWTKSQFALIGSVILIGLIANPIAGRMTDIFGAKRVAAAGIVAGPLIYVAYSFMSGDFGYFLFLNALQISVVGATSTTIVYGRLVADGFERARGIALAIAASAPIATAAIAAPLLSGFMAAHGWREGYIALAIASAAGGAVALMMMPGRRPIEQQAAQSAARLTLKDYFRLANDRSFLIIAAGLLLSNLTLTVQAPNLSLMLIDKGISAQTASFMVSIYAIGIVIGRLCCGLALDRYPSHIVAVVGFGMPGIGLIMLGSSIANPVLLGIAVMIVGQALGAELAITAYLIMRYFKAELYGTIFSMMYVLVSLSALFGALLLSATLQQGGSFAPFLILSALCTLAGGAMFGLLGRRTAASVAAAQP